jgi:hypothetical protein
VAKARFAIEGDKTYPDATFTLRLAFGQVKGYEEQGKKLPPWTTMGGAYKHAADHGSVPPFALPPRWLKDKDRLAADTPFDFVSTADIIGGNSGSPVVNREGQVIGLIFDSNIPALPNRFLYTSEAARSVAVHSEGILEALKNIYGAEKLREELRPGK